MATIQPELPSDYDRIRPLPDFQLKQENPLKLYPWKPKSYLTLGTQNLCFSEYLPLDCTLPDRLRLRRKIVSKYEEVVLSAMPSSVPAIREFYRWLIGNYLPNRYPNVYRSYPAQHLSNETRGFITCSIDGTKLPLEPPTEPHDILRIIAENVDAEFFFLQARKYKGNRKYIARAYIDCYPFGFDPREKIGLTLAEIHKPVPGFKKKLQLSMDRFFASLPKGKIVKRHNWNVALDHNLYSPEHNPLMMFPVCVLKLAKWMMELFLPSRLPKLRLEDLDPDQVTVRCERQTLHRLQENDDTLVFTFKTYQYSLRKIKDEGLGESLAEAILGQNHSIKEMEWYKGSVYWRDAVIAYLHEQD
ncbi:hypothetical protein yc1106_06658 [Curvularia clavata]|uniref:Uncharacterized protein n=1 Tax=Curvularia clavata TaxID=95742 RepID=A0A9Q8ZDC3_CURCL|nr:hypothetical protein yc1106_06658 [Curvularia clavata]